MKIQLHGKNFFNEQFCCVMSLQAVHQALLDRVPEEKKDSVVT